MVSPTPVEVKFDKGQEKRGHLYFSDWSFSKVDPTNRFSKLSVPLILNDA